MCGVVGLLALDGSPVDRSLVGAMSTLLLHRGPDDSGSWTSGAIGLGHRRLSIIDLSEQGRNPMANEDGSVQLVFNGEIYNHVELRREIERGHAFRSRTDTEVVVHGYEQFGLDFIARLNGMFAFALWDENQRRLVLARDRFGVKPLYYAVIGRLLAFASEAKAFLALPGFRARADVRGLADHFAFQNTFGSRTLFDGVKLLEAGQILVCERGEIVLRTYWEPPLETREDASLADLAQDLRERFERSVNAQLMSDVPLGSFLSGGMDTGSISAVAARRLSRMHTFTCGFRLPEKASDREKFFDERTLARLLADELDTVHHELELDETALPIALPRVVWHLDEPRVGICYQVLYTSLLIRKHVTVVLSGVGGDELFAGYPWRYDLVGGWQPDQFEENYYRVWSRLLSDDERRALFSEELNQALGGYSPREACQPYFDRTRGLSPVSRALHFDFQTFLNGLLIVDDKLSMASSVEARVPFLDNDLVDLAMRIPPGLKARPGEGKVILKQAMRGLLPDAVLERRKQGFTPPDGTWYKGPLLAFVRDLVVGDRALDRGFFRRAALEKIFDDHLNDRRDHRFLLWSLMCFEWWNRLFVDREPLPAP